VSRVTPRQNRPNENSSEENGAMFFFCERNMMATDGEHTMCYREVRNV
jgi:hypothetical protein